MNKPVFSILNQCLHSITPENLALVNQCINSLVDDNRIPNHPIKQFLYNTNFKNNFYIVFNTDYAGAGARASQDNIFIRANENTEYYLSSLAHEFIHTAIMNNYISDNNYMFLIPLDYAFRMLMEEAFANTISIWVHLNFNEVERNYEIRKWCEQGLGTRNEIVDAMFNDIKDENPDYSIEKINTMVIVNNFELYLTKLNKYTLKLSAELSEYVMYGNTFLIPKYKNYTEQGDLIVRHQWNYLMSIMPVEVQQYMKDENKTYEYYRNRFLTDIKEWAMFQAQSSKRPEESILYWLSIDYINIAKERIKNQQQEERYYYLTKEDEKRLDNIIKEMDILSFNKP